MKFELNWPKVSEKTMVWYIDGTERSKVLGQPWPLEHIYSQFHIRLNISSENNVFGCNSFQKSTFQKIPNLNALGYTFDLNV